MKVKQKRPSRYIASRSLSPVRDEVEVDCASIRSNMVEVYSSSTHGTTTWISFTNQKRKANETTISNMPESVMHSILLGIPALTLRGVTRKVCKEWKDIISDSNFKKEHSTLNASDGFLVQKFMEGDNCPFLSYLVEIRNDTNAVTIYRIPLLETIHASSGGFLIIKEDGPASNFSVLDPGSGKIVMNVPPSPVAGGSFLFCGFAHAPSTGKHKVVRFYSHRYFGNVCVVLSIGTESKWRPIDVGSLRCPSFLGGTTICAGRYVYWATSVDNHNCEIVTFDAETESMFYGTTLRNLKIIRFPYYFLPIENYLSLVIHHDNYKWKAWKLTDFRTGIWELIFKIDLSSQRRLIEREISKGNVLIKPLAWLRNGELILFQFTYPSRCCIAHDVRKGKFFWFELPKDETTGESAYFHVNGIFSLNSS